DQWSPDPPKSPGSRDRRADAVCSGTAMAASSATYPTPARARQGPKALPRGFTGAKDGRRALGHLEPDRAVESPGPIGLVAYQEALLRPENRGFAEVCLKIFEAKSKA